MTAMMREKIGSFMSRQDSERFLNLWIQNYVLLDDTANQETKSQFPLREARIEVSELPERPGVYLAHSVSPAALPIGRVEHIVEGCCATVLDWRLTRLRRQQPRAGVVTQVISHIDEKHLTHQGPQIPRGSSGHSEIGPSQMVARRRGEVRSFLHVQFLRENGVEKERILEAKYACRVMEAWTARGPEFTVKNHPVKLPRFGVAARGKAKGLAMERAKIRKVLVIY
jgi:EvpB/VC_A0108, tail sheath gpW/gp25-like domain